MQGNIPDILKDLSSIGKKDRVDVIGTTDLPEINSCEILGEYFSEDIASLKNALKDKIVQMETLNGDIKDLATTLSNVVEEMHGRSEVSK